MKISLWHLYERLLEYAPTANITEGRCVIENVRIFSPSNQLYFTDYVYLVSLDAEYGWKTPQETVILFHRNDMIILHHATFHEVMNKIMDIFDQFRNIEQKLKQACQSDRPYEDMLTILYDYYHLPIVITNNNLKILAATPVIGAIMNGWDIIFETHYMPVTFFSVFNNEENNRRFITCKHPFLMDPVNQNAAKYYRKLFVIPFEINQLSAGKVLINLFEDTISPGSLLMERSLRPGFQKFLMPETTRTACPIILKTPFAITIIQKRKCRLFTTCGAGNRKRFSLCAYCRIPAVFSPFPNSAGAAESWK